MYMRAQVGVNLGGTVQDVKSPTSFFAGLGNFFRHGTWGKKTEVEGYRVAALASAVQQAMAQMGIQNVVRLAMGPTAIYEDLHEQPNDLDLALAALKERQQEGWEPSPQDEFSMVLRHDDGVLTYVLDFRFTREHIPGRDPLVVRVTAIPSDFRKAQGETDEAFQRRLAGLAQNSSLSQTQAQFGAQFQSFLEGLENHLKSVLDVEQIRVESRGVVPRIENAESLGALSAPGYPLYGYNPATDLAFLYAWSMFPSPMWGAPLMVGSYDLGMGGSWTPHMDTRHAAGGCGWAAAGCGSSGPGASCGTGGGDTGGSTCAASSCAASSCASGGGSSCGGSSCGGGGGCGGGGCGSG